MEEIISTAVAAAFGLGKGYQRDVDKGESGSFSDFYAPELERITKDVAEDVRNHLEGAGQEVDIS